MDSDTNKDEYFASYEDLEVHTMMLRDEHRTYSYRRAILSNKGYFKNKIVMDVGCGTGILSIFCAQAGAKKVYAVEASHIANLAKEIVKENRCEDIVEVIHSTVEDVVLPDNIKVDAIVSEWMGFYLLHEGMLDSVIIARDKFLKEDGQMFPETAAVYIAPCSVPTMYNIWDNIHGVAMTSLAAHLRNNRYHKPEIVLVNPDDLLAPPEVFCWISLKEVKSSELDHLTLRHVSVASKAGRYQGLCLWFDCSFPDLSQEREESQVVLSTAPDKPETHWKQTVIVLPQEQEVDESEPIAFQLDMTRNTDNRRRYTLSMELLDPDVMEHPLPCSCFLTKCIIIKAFMQENPTKENEVENILEEDAIDDDER